MECRWRSQGTAAAQATECASPTPSKRPESALLAQVFSVELAWKMHRREAFAKKLSHGLPEASRCASFTWMGYFVRLWHQLAANGVGYIAVPVTRRFREPHNSQEQRS